MPRKKTEEAVSEEADVAALAKEIATLKKEIASLKRELAKKPAGGADPRVDKLIEALNLKDLTRQLLEKVDLL